MGACGSLVFMIGVFLHSECHTEEVLDPRSGGPAEKEATTHGTWKASRSALRSGVHPPGVTAAQAPALKVWDGLGDGKLRMLHNTCPLANPE